MSYVRFGSDGSDVYVYLSDRGLECCGCRLVERGFTAASTEEMVTHLAEHTAAGDGVPDYVVPDLRADDAENFPLGTREAARDAALAAWPNRALGRDVSGGGQGA